MKKIFIASAVVLSLISAGASAYEEGTVIGKPGDPSKASRTVELTMIDNRFEPSEISVKAGETVKFIARNTGKKKHMFVIGSTETLDKLAKKIHNSPDEEQTGPNMISVDPGKSGELAWEFTEAGTVGFACPLPGHYKGMRGNIEVSSK